MRNLSCSPRRAPEGKIPRQTWKLGRWRTCVQERELKGAERRCGTGGSAGRRDREEGDPSIAREKDVKGEEIGETFTRKRE